MPYKVTGSDSKWYVVNSETGEKKNKTPHPSREKALAHMRALYANEPAGEKLAEISGRKKSNNS